MFFYLQIFHKKYKGENGYKTVLTETIDLNMWVIYLALFLCDKLFE